jgi:cytochrome c553
VRRVLVATVALVALLVCVGASGYVYAGSESSSRLARKFDIAAKDIPIPFPLSTEEIAALRAERVAKRAADDATDPLAGMDLEAIALERALTRAKALIHGRVPCTECHGENGAGKLVVDAQPVWTWYAPNITRGGRTRAYSGRDWDRIIRHGVKPDGMPATMPSMDFVALSDQEVSDLAAYFRSLPASQAVQPPTVLGPVGKALIAFGKMPLSAETIDHAREHLRIPPPAAIDVTFGAHVAATCVGCHRADFSGGPITQGPPDWPPAGNLTPQGLARWSVEDFMRALRQGKRPDGTELREPMRAVTKLQLTDVELGALFAYLKQLPAKTTAQ